MWKAASRAVRTPSRAENDVAASPLVFSPSAATGGLPTVVQYNGSSSLASEELLALEAGYRWQTSDYLSFDLATLYNFYDRLVSASTGTSYVTTTNGVPHIVVPLNTNNDGEADVYGF